MGVSKEKLLAWLGRYREHPLRWHLEDPCFLHVDLYRYFHEYESPEARDAFRNQVMAPHWRECGGCLTNIRARSDSATDAEERDVYGTLVVLALRVNVQASGGTFRLTEDAEGAWITQSPSPDIAQWISQIDSYSFRDLRPGFQILRVTGKGVFDDPTPLLQALDQSSCRDIQRSQERPEWNGLQWSELHRVVKVTSFLYWNGQTKLLSEEDGLTPRYRRLVAKHLRDEETERDVDGALALALRDLALKYDGRSRFSGYASATLRNRAIDRHRHRQTDGLGRAQIGEDPDRPLDELPSGQTSEDTDLRIAVDQLKKRLSGRQLEILKLLAADPDQTDEQLGAILGVTRETINRDRSKIRATARELKLESP